MNNIKKGKNGDPKKCESARPTPLWGPNPRPADTLTPQLPFTMGKEVASKKTASAWHSAKKPSSPPLTAHSQHPIDTDASAFSKQHKTEKLENVSVHAVEEDVDATIGVEEDGKEEQENLLLKKFDELQENVKFRTLRFNESVDNFAQLFKGKLDEGTRKAVMELEGVKRELTILNFALVNVSSTLNEVISQSKCTSEITRTALLRIEEKQAEDNKLKALLATQGDIIKDQQKAACVVASLIAIIFFFMMGRISNNI